MDKRIEKIKKQVKKECELDRKLRGWFFEVHLLNVERFALEMLKKFPKADREVVMLGVWLHDIQRIRRVRGDHELAGAREAGKILREYEYDEDTIKRVEEIISTHSGDERLPKNIEGKILTTADAMAFYYKDFPLHIAVKGERNVEEFKAWTMDKLERNYRRKIFFDFARKKIKARHELWKKVMTMG